MIRFLPYFIELALLVFCLIDCIQTPGHQVRNLEKPIWILLILLVPIIGGVAWLVAGRPTSSAAKPQWRVGGGFPEDERRRPAPGRNEDDAAFMAEMARIDREHEEALKKWQAKLEAQEAELRRREAGEGRA